MPNRNLHLTSTLVAGEDGKHPTGCGKRVARRYVTAFLDDAPGCPGCLANPEAVEQARRYSLAVRRGLYVARLNCRGKVAAHKATGEDLSDVDAGLRCGLIHLGACNPSGEDFDAEKFAALEADLTAKPEGA